MSYAVWPPVEKGKPPPAVKLQAWHDLPVGSIVGVVGRGMRGFLHRAANGWSQEAVRPAAKRYGPYSNVVQPKAAVEAMERVSGTAYLLRLGNGSEADLRAWKSAMEGPGALVPQARKRGAPLPDMAAWTIEDIAKRLGWVSGDDERLAAWVDAPGQGSRIKKVVEAGLWAYLSRGVTPETMTTEEWIRRAAKLRGVRLWETPDEVGVYSLNQEFPAAKDGDAVLTGVGTPRPAAHIRQRGAYSAWGDPFLVGEFQRRVRDAAHRGDVPDHIRVSVGLQPVEVQREAAAKSAATAQMQREDRATWLAVYEAAPLRVTVEEAVAGRFYLVDVKKHAYMGDTFEYWGVPRKARGHNYDVEGSGRFGWRVHARPGSTTQMHAYPDARSLREALRANYPGDLTKMPRDSTVLAAASRLGQAAKDSE